MGLKDKKMIYDKVQERVPTLTETFDADKLLYIIKNFNSITISTSKTDIFEYFLYYIQ